MSCTFIRDGVLCTDNSRNYRFNGYYFEFNPMWGPSLLNKDGSISNRQPVSDKAKFWKDFAIFSELSDEQKETFEVDKWRRGQ